MYTYEDKMPLQHIAELALHATSGTAVQICRYIAKQHQTWTMAVAAEASILGQVSVPGTKPRKIPANGPLEKVFEKAEPYHGPFETMCLGMVDSYQIAQLVKKTGVRHALALPIRPSGQVEGAIFVYHTSLLTDAQIAHLKPALAILEGLFGHMERRQDAKKRLRRAERLGVSLAEAEEKLRREIAVELHGRIQGKLVLVWHELKKCASRVSETSEEMAARLSRLAEMVDQVRDRDIRELSHRLHPSAIRIALRPALGQLIDQYEKAMDVTLKLSPQLVEFDNPLHNRIPERVRLATYRLVEEALANALHHGRAARAVVCIDVLNGNMLEVSVSDTGRGFIASRSAWGLGMELMEGRVTAAHGILRVTSVPGQGTLVLARIPLAVPHRSVPVARRSFTRGIYP